MLDARRISKQERTLEAWQAFQAKRNIYFHEIRASKKASWTTFLEESKGKDIFTAYKYTKPRRIEKIPLIQGPTGLATDFKGKCQAFLQALFPPPP